MIQQLQLRAWKGFSTPSVDLRCSWSERSGKTSILDAVEFLCRLNVPTRTEVSDTRGRFAELLPSGLVARLRTHGVEGSLGVTAALRSGTRVELSVTSAQTVIET